MSEYIPTPDSNERVLVGIKTALEIVFPDPDTRPSLRSWNDWRAKGYYPYVKIQKRVFICPEAARKALESRFTIEANG